MDDTVPSLSPTRRVTPMPADANFHGDIFGGRIMSQVDLAGSIPASQRAHGRVATVAVNSFVFKQPLLIGDVVSFFAEITKVGRTSITVAVEVYAQRDPGSEITVKVTEASLTYVAVGRIASRARFPRYDAPHQSVAIDRVCRLRHIRCPKAHAPTLHDKGNAHAQCIVD